MSRFEDPSIVSHYQFTRSSGSTSRPQSSLPSKDAVTDMFNIGIDNRNQLQRPETSPLSIRRLTRYPVRIPTASLVISPPILDPRTSTPDQNITLNRPLSASLSVRMGRSIPIRLKSSALTIPPPTNTEEISYQNFPKQNHEKRKKAHERKRRKQLRQTFSDKYSEAETWLRLRRSLVELKRLATTQEILIDPSTSVFNCDGHSCRASKQTSNEQSEDKKAAIFKSESGMSSLFGASLSARDLNRPSMTASQNSFSRPSTAKRPTETYPRSIFEPLIVSSKPIHSPTDKINPPIKTRIKPSATAPPRPQPNFTVTLSPEEEQPEVPIIDHFNDDNPSPSSTPTPPVIKPDQENSSRKIVTPSPVRMRPPSGNPVSSTIKLRSQTPRCRSATEAKPSFIMNKNYPRFIIIADEDHRIESWYHQYPFVLGDDLLTSFECKQPQQKSTISAYFIDDLQTSNPNITAKTFLQGKPFHINNDWKKYDLIFISNNISEQILVYLKTIIKLIKSSGKIIKVYQINHDEELKKQVRHVCKQLQQQQNV